MKICQHINIRLILCASVFLGSIFYVVQAGAVVVYDQNSLSRITEEVIPMALDRFPKRPAPIIEMGDPFLGPGEISQGFELPTGAVWQPKLQVYGQYRSAFQKFHNGNDVIVEWANRLNVFVNLDLTESERILMQIRFLDKKGQFSGYTFKAPRELRSSSSGSDNAFNAIVRTLFFEGNIGEMFPKLDIFDKKGLDIGFSIGRQFLGFQETMLIADHIDSVGISKLNLRPGFGILNLRSSFVYGNNDIARRNLADDANAQLFGIFNEFDLRKTTIQADLIYVDAEDSTGDGLYGGFSATQRFGHLNSTFRLLFSEPVGGQETEHNRNGMLLFGQLGYTPHHTDNYLYVALFKAIQNFRSASREPGTQGPLGRTGILFEVIGLGRIQPALNNQTNDAYGGAIGYQMFWNNKRSQLIAEIGTHQANNSTGQRAVAGGLRYQKAIGRRTTLRIDGYVKYDDNQGIISANPQDVTYGARMEIQIRF